MIRMPLARAGPDLAGRASMLVAALDLLRGKFKEAAARAVGAAAASWVADLVRKATGGRIAPDDPVEDYAAKEEDDMDGWGWREPREPEPIPSSAPSAWPWMLALALLLCLPSLRLAGPASLAAALSP